MMPLEILIMTMILKNDEMVNAENQENNLDDENVINEKSSNFEVGGQVTHPADNLLAKWKLLGLFNESLETPVYIRSSMLNLN
jgi:hypothetical protein